MRDMDFDVPIADARRLEVVVDGLPLQGGAQPAVDTTLVCASHADGRPRLGAARHDGVALKVARRKNPLSTQKLLVPPAEPSWLFWQPGWGQRRLKFS